MKTDEPIFTGTELMRGFNAGYAAGIEEGRKRMLAEQALAPSEWENETGENFAEMVRADYQTADDPF